MKKLLMSACAVLALTQGGECRAGRHGTDVGGEGYGTPRPETEELRDARARMLPKFAAACGGGNVAIGNLVDLFEGERKAIDNLILIVRGSRLASEMLASKFPACGVFCEILSKSLAKDQKPIDIVKRMYLKRHAGLLQVLGGDGAIQDEGGLEAALRDKQRASRLINPSVADAVMRKFLLQMFKLDTCLTEAMPNLLEEDAFAGLVSTAVAGAGNGAPVLKRAFMEKKSLAWMLVEVSVLNR